MGRGAVRQVWDFSGRNARGQAEAIIGEAIARRRQLSYTRRQGCGGFRSFAHSAGPREGRYHLREGNLAEGCFSVAILAGTTYGFTLVETCGMSRGTLVQWAQGSQDTGTWRCWQICEWNSAPRQGSLWQRGLCHLQGSDTDWRASGEPDTAELDSPTPDNSGKSHQRSGMDRALVESLRYLGLLDFQYSLAELGIRTRSDLGYFEELEFCGLGLTRLESRKLLNLSAQTMGYPAPQQLEAVVAAGMPDRSKLADAIRTARQKTRNRLKNSYEIASGKLEQEHKSVQNIIEAIHNLQEPPESQQRALDALHAVSRAVSYCPHDELTMSLDKAKQAIRDLLTWLVQSQVEW